MATSSEVKAALDDIAQVIRTERKACASAKARITSARGNLDLIPTAFSDVLSTINGYGESDAFEALSKAELAKMTTEFLALRSATNDAVAGLVEITEF